MHRKSLAHAAPAFWKELRLQRVCTIHPRSDNICEKAQVHGHPMQAQLCYGFATYN